MLISVKLLIVLFMRIHFSKLYNNYKIKKREHEVAIVFTAKSMVYFKINKPCIPVDFLKLIFTYSFYEIKIVTIISVNIT